VARRFLFLASAGRSGKQAYQIESEETAKRRQNESGISKNIVKMAGVMAKMAWRQYGGVGMAAA